MTSGAFNHNYFVKNILAANIYDLAKETPVHFAGKLSQRMQNQVWIKREDLQPVFSFKLRGAYNCLLNLTPQERAAGVIAASAGNHAQGLAYAARHLNIQATIVMPTTTPEIKVDAVRSFGANVILHGDGFPEAYRHSLSLVDHHQLIYIHPFDNDNVIAGQGTVGVELMRQIVDLDAVFIPVGGGGLIAGMSVYIKYLNPDIKIIGVEPEDAASMQAALQAGKVTKLNEIGLFADGVAVAQVGDRNFTIAKHCVDDIVTVTTDEMCAAIKDLYDDTRAIAEPAGACAVAGLKKYCLMHDWQDQTLAVVSSGANVNFDRLRHVAERADIGEQREAIIAATIPEQPGSFQAFCKALGGRNITEFNYRYADQQQARVFVGVQTQAGQEDRGDLLSSLAKQGIQTMDLTDNEMAKIHVRYMVGGHAQVDNEAIYRFTFPERPGALITFLTKLGRNWNISMFHYRNHGSAYGRVMIGLQVPTADKQRLLQYLDELGYDFKEETDNQAYQLFLKPTPS